MNLLLNSLAMLGLLFAMPVSAADQECGVCGLEITPSSNVFTLTHADGTTQTYGCPGCGLYALHAIDNDNSVRAEAQDFLARTPIDARAAWYVRGSSVGFCCEVSWLAFATREDAERFSTGFGGEVLDFEVALSKAAGDDHGGMAGGEGDHHHHH
jgi:hypothetical protein